MRTKFSLAPLPMRVGILVVVVAIPIALSIMLAFSYVQQQQQKEEQDYSLPEQPVYDKFGIQKLFSTKAGGREWFMDLENPKGHNNDDVFEVSNGQKIVRMPDGSWYGEGEPPDHRTRIMIKSPPGYDPWINVEMTAYFKVERTYGHELERSSDAHNSFQAYARGGTHSNQLMAGSDGKLRYLNCLGSAYKGRIYFDGSVNVAKEIGHSVYAPARFAQTPDGAWQQSGRDQFMPLVRDYNSTDAHFYGGRWTGLKVIIYNMDIPPNADTTAATASDSQQHKGTRILVYIDEQAEDANGNLQPSNRWRLLADVVDAGDWAVEDRRHHINNTAIATAVGSADEDGGGVDTVQELINICGNPFRTAEEYASMVITWPGHPLFIDDPEYRALANAASFRWDYAGAKFTYLSVREIDPFSSSAAAPLTN